jgi:uncharacterized protein YjeT (DUF2065 family)
MDKMRRWTLTYLVTYLVGAGLGFSFLPEFTMDALQSNGEYGDVMPRVVGMIMLGLGTLIFTILRNEDWKYYVVSIWVRTWIVAFLFYVYAISDDPMFLVINGVVLVGLIPSYVVHFRRR